MLGSSVGLIVTKEATGREEMRKKREWKGREEKEREGREGKFKEETGMEG